MDCEKGKKFDGTKGGGGLVEEERSTVGPS
jgi:hypothetical protein